MTRLALALLPWVAAMLVGACAANAPVSLPSLAVSPGAMARPVVAQQRMTLLAHGRRQQLQLALEIDAEGVRIAVFDLGQTVARLAWDGRELEVASAPGWPQAVQPSQMLALVQLVHWPAAALRAALPLGWTLEDDGDRRVLHRGGDPVLSIAYTAGDRVEIRAAHDAFEVLIESVPVEPAR